MTSKDVTLRKVTVEFVPITKPSRRDVCASCWFDYAEVKSVAGKFHHECLDMHMREFHNPPERLVKKNRSKE